MTVSLAVTGRGGQEGGEHEGEGKGTEHDRHPLISAEGVELVGAAEREELMVVIDERR